MHRLSEVRRQFLGNMDEIVVIGGGGHARVVLSVLRKLKCFRVLGYTDLNDQDSILGAAYLGPDRKLAALASRRKSLKAVMAVGQVGTGEQREALWTGFSSFSLQFPAIVSPDAIVNEEVSVGEATVVMDGAVINSGAVIGRGAIVNTHSTIEHDVAIGDWVHVAPGATISGGVEVGRFSMIGAGATVIEGIKIVAGCIVGAGAVVVRDFQEPGVYVGCPARRIK